MIELEIKEISHLGMDADVYSPEVPDLQDKDANVNPVDSIEKPMANSTYRRVKVKLKTSNMVESHHNSSDGRTQSDTDKSSLKTGLDRYGVMEKADDSSSSLSMIKVHVSENSSKKSENIKIKSSISLPFSDSHCNIDELDASLVVIKKVMNMDAAEPFNAPVNPEELGIPDYFDVIETPMDFGTIKKNLENSSKYNCSEDVYKDVQYIWENCYKYNNKGDYILDLMKRVKKNFAKYWTSAGLYIESSKRGFQSFHESDAFSTEGKIFTKSGHSKHKVRKRHRYKYHKEDCLCAICVMRCSKKEREDGAQISENPIGRCDPNFPQKFEQEDEPVGECPSEGDTSSNNMDVSGDDAAETETELEEKEGMCCSKADDGPEERDEMAGKPGGEEVVEKPVKEEKRDLSEMEKEMKGEKRRRVVEGLKRYENPVIVEMYRRLFSKEESAWTGPHSLAAAQSVAARPRGSIHKAIAGFM